MSSSDSNGTGKRKINDEEDSSDGPPSKSLKSDESSSENKSTENSSPPNSTDDDDGKDDSNSGIKSEDNGKENSSADNKSNPGETKKEEGEASFVVDREGVDTATKSESQEDTKSTIVKSEEAAQPKAQVYDPRKAATASHNPVAQANIGVDPNAHATISNPNQNPNQIIEERGEVSALYVGRVIGKGGEMIRDLQARSGARIDVDQNVPPGQPRLITYKGTRETVEFAKQLVAMLSTEGVSEHDLPLGHAAQAHVVIPAQCVGKVIGRGGEMIRELQSRSHAKIQIDHSGRSGLPPDQKQVTVTGTREAVAKGKEMVEFLVANPMMDASQSLNMLIEEKARSGAPWGTGGPYPSLPNQGVNMHPSMTQQPGFAGGGIYQQPGGYNQPPMGGFGGPPPGVGGIGGMHPHHHMMGQQSTGGVGHGGRESEVVYAAKQFMGRIIGGKGVTVNDLQRRCGCDIQINQDVPPGQDCEITIRGTRQGIEQAKQMIKDIIETGPQHPYAGGADSYGGGMGGYQQQQQPGGYQQQQQFGYQQGYDQGYGQQPTYSQPQAYVPPTAAFGQPALPPAYGGGYGGPPQQQYGAFPPQGMAQVPVYQQQQPPPPHQQPKAPPPVQAAPSPWKTASAPDGQVYYYNERTGETQWEKPAGMP